MHIEKIPFNELSGYTPVGLPKDCWILNIVHQDNNLYLNIAIDNPTDAVEWHEYLILFLSHNGLNTNAVEQNVDDLIFIGSCSSKHNQYFVFEVSPKE